MAAQPLKPGRRVGYPREDGTGRGNEVLLKGTLSGELETRDPQGLAGVDLQLPGKGRVPQGLEDDEVSDLVEAHQTLIKRSFGQAEGKNRKRGTPC